MRLKIESLKDRFCNLLSQHGKIVLKVANTYAFESEDRRDLVQDIKIQLWKSFPAYDERRPFSTWMYRVSLNVAVSHVRSKRSSKPITVPLDDPLLEHLADSSMSNDFDPRLDFLGRFTESLAPLDKALLLLYLEQQSYMQISEILGISETNVATKIGRLKQLARATAASEISRDAHAREK